MVHLPVHRFPGHDGLELVYREMGDGRPVVLLHGFASTALQWIHHGRAATIAEHGYRVILPDLRGHGDSARPPDPVSYPPDVLDDDGLALIDWLGLDDYDLGGYSLGGRIVLRMLVRGARPARAIVVGQGLDAVNRALNTQRPVPPRVERPGQSGHHRARVTGGGTGAVDHPVRRRPACTLSCPGHARRDTRRRVMPGRDPHARGGRRPGHAMINENMHTE